MRDKQQRSAVRTDLLGKFGSPVFQFVDPDHTRWTKRYPDASLDVQVEHGGRVGEEWIAIRVEERHQTKPDGVEYSRVISVALHGEHRAALLAYLSKSEG